ncbi:hypothetical protein [Agromyces sp. SYSU T00266]|uniref:hypothetical protein n=1 Tax=Agromyces zhanjiangensis TaxID=3158562 RepID=UPI0033957AE4
MRAPADDEPMPDFGEPRDDADDARAGGRRSRADRAADEGAAVERDRWAMRASAHPGRRPRRRAAAITFDPADHQDPDRRRYFLSSLQPSGDYEAVIVAITDGSSRRYFSSRDGSHFIEVDELSFEQRRKSGSRSMLEIGEHELRELEGALIFVRPLDGRDPIAEVAAAKQASLEATRPMAIVPVAAAEAVAASTADEATTDGATDDATADDASTADEPNDDDAALVPAPSDEEAPVDDPVPAAEGDESSAAPDARADDVTDDGAADSALAWADESTAPADETSEPQEPGPRRSTFEPVAPGAPPDPESSDSAEASVVGVFDPIEAPPIPPIAPAPRYVSESVESAEPVESIESAEADPGPLRAPEPEPAPAPAAARRTAPLSTLDAVAQVALAKGIAFAAHRGQLDKSGTPYIDHPGRIAERFDPVTDPIAAAAAWLHDVLEDTPLTSRELFEAGVLLEIVGVVELLTRRPEVSPDEYYARIRRHPVALRVKLADIDDNTAPWRLRRLEFAKQQRLAEKYRHARRALGVD